MSMSPMSKASMGGSKRLGEMELTQLEALGMKNCLQEFVERSEACVVEVCNVCRCITILCGCSPDSREEHGVFEVILSSSSIAMMIGNRVMDKVNLTGFAKEYQQRLGAFQRKQQWQIEMQTM